jgi:hypothetical protein
VAVGPGTARIGARTFRPERRIPAAAWAAVGAAAALAVLGAAAFVLRILTVEPGAAESLRRLGPAYVSHENGVETIDLSFAGIPENFTRPELVKALFSVCAPDELTAGRGAGAAPPQVSIDLPGPALRFREMTGPAAFRFPFTRLDEARLQDIRIEFGSIVGSMDIGLYLIHRDGARLRSLLFRLHASPQPPRKGAATEGVHDEPAIEARRNGEPVALSPPPGGMPVLGSGTYTVQIRLSPEGGSSRIHLDLYREGASGGRIFPAVVPDEGFLAPGLDWQEGILALKVLSPIAKGALSVGKMVLVGVMDHGRPLEAPPADLRDDGGTTWRS